MCVFIISEGHPNDMKNYTYILKCSDGSLYTGWTNNLEHRLRDHNSGKGAKYTKIRCPVVLVYSESYKTKEEAMKREYAIKKMSRSQKLELISGKLENENIHNNEVADAAAHDK